MLLSSSSSSSSWPSSSTPSPTPSSQFHPSLQHRGRRRRRGPGSGRHCTCRAMSSQCDFTHLALGGGMHWMSAAAGDNDGIKEREVEPVYMRAPSRQSRSSLVYDGFFNWTPFPSRAEGLTGLPPFVRPPLLSTKRIAGESANIVECGVLRSDTFRRLWRRGERRRGGGRSMGI